LKNANTKKGNPIFLNMNMYLRQANKIRFYALGYDTGRQKDIF